MFLTRECDYAIRVVRALADTERKSVKNICDIECIPRSFAYKILKKLEYAGIVRSCRGVAGGYRLIKEPDSLTIFDILSAVDNTLLLNECLQDGVFCPRNTDEHMCAVHQELIRLQDLLVFALKEKNMTQLV